MADREMVVLDDARRIPPDAIGSAGAGDDAASAVGGTDACEFPAWLRWTGGRTADAADVSGRSGTWIALRATVGSDRTGVISGSAVLMVSSSSSADRATTVGEDEVAELVVPADRTTVVEAEPVAAVTLGSGSSSGGGSEAGVAAASRWAARPDRRGTGMLADDEDSTARTRATTSPDAANGLTSWPSCCTTGGRPWVPGRDSTNAPGADTCGMEPAAR